MKRLIVILPIFFNANVMANTPVSLSYEQATKLVKAAWKEPARSIDITYYLTVRDDTKPEQELRQIYEEAHEQMYGPKEQLNPYMLKNRERFVQMNVERFLKEQQEGGRKVKYGIRFDANRQRVDKVYASPEKVLDANTPFEMSFIEVTDQNNVSERYVYSRGGKTATRQIINRRAKFENSKIMSFMMMPEARRLRSQLGTCVNGSHAEPYDYYIDQIKYEKLCSNTLDSMSVRIQPDTDEPDANDRIELTFYNVEKEPYAKSIIVCARQDYSRVFYYDVRIAATDQIMLVRRCSNFDSQGFPHNVTIIEYDVEGKVQFQETYKIESVRLNIPLPDEVFEFAPPRDYAVIDFRLPPAEREAAEVMRLKEWLAHEVWTDRLRALVALKQYLRDDPVQLRNIATSMLDDKHPVVRKAASSILDHLGENK